MRQQPRAGGAERFGRSLVTRQSWSYPSSLGSSVPDPSLTDPPVHFDVLPGWLAREDVVEAQVELMLLRHRRKPAIGGFVLGESDENDLVWLAPLMAGQLHERPRNLGADVPLPVLHELRELRLLAGFEGGTG